MHEDFIKGLRVFSSFPYREGRGRLRNLGNCWQVTEVMHV